MTTMNRNRGVLSPFVTMFILVAIVLFTALTQLESGLQVQAVRQSTVPAIEWTGLGEHIVVPGGMTVRSHASKHSDQVLDAWKIYTLLLEGQCVASAVFCGPSDIEKLYLCIDPAGRIGGLVVFGNEILTGYQAKQDYWSRKVDGPEWEVCRD